jgi:hypothetical protein
MVYTFKGGAVAVYGSVQGDHGLYSGLVDAYGSVTYNSSAPFLAVPALLFFQAGLDPNATHTVHLVNGGPGKLYLDIDSIVIYK